MKNFGISSIRILKETTGQIPELQNRHLKLIKNLKGSFKKFFPETTTRYHERTNCKNSVRILAKTLQSSLLTLCILYSPCQKLRENLTLNSPETHQKFRKKLKNCRQELCRVLVKNSAESSPAAHQKTFKKLQYSRQKFTRILENELTRNLGRKSADI